MTTSDSSLKRTPLNALHRELSGKLVDFAGWEMPVEFSGVVDEHMTVRGKAGLFDVSHMGQFFVSGPGAEALLQSLTPNDVSKLAIGQAQYSALTTERGAFVDDVLVYRIGDDRYMLVPNAANIEKDFDWIDSRRSGSVELRNASDEYALLALQGPEATAILEPLTDVALDAMKYYRFAPGKVLGEEATVSRTGYTGEDGFEIMVSAERAEKMARELLERGSARGLHPSDSFRESSDRRRPCRRGSGSPPRRRRSTRTSRRASCPRSTRRACRAPAPCRRAPDRRAAPW